MFSIDCQHLFAARFGISVLLFFAAVVGLSGPSVASNAVEIELDEARIPLYGAITGQLIVDLKEELGMPVLPSLFNGGVDILIRNEAGDVVEIVNRAEVVQVDNSPCGLVGNGAVPPGSYTIPFALVKDTKRFFFDESGYYNLELRFCEGSGLGSVQAQIEVYECMGCDVGGYVQAFGYGQIMAAFDDGRIRLDGVDESDVYGRQLRKIWVYTAHPVLARRIWKGYLEPEERSVEIFERSKGCIENAAGVATDIGMNVDFWNQMYGKLMALGGSTASSAADAGAAEEKVIRIF